jgi:hypothetical protein
MRMTFANKQEAQAFIDRYATERFSWVAVFEAIYLINGQPCINFLGYFDSGWKNVPDDATVQLHLLTAMSKAPKPKPIGTFSISGFRVYPNSTLKELGLTSKPDVDPNDLEAATSFQQMQADYLALRAKQDLTKED